LSRSAEIKYFQQSFSSGEGQFHQMTLKVFRTQNQFFKSSRSRGSNGAFEPRPFWQDWFRNRK
jgi:hypothetical protein